MSEEQIAIELTAIYCKDMKPCDEIGLVRIYQNILNEIRGTYTC